MCSSDLLTPQGFIAFRDGLGTASGFETYQMREFEILLGLANEDRLYGMDPISTFRKLAKNSERDSAILARLEDVAAKPSLSESLMRWVSRTPIMGSLAGNDDDEDTVAEYIETHLNSHEKIGKQAAERMSGYGASSPEEAAERFAASHQEIGRAHV